MINKTNNLLTKAANKFISDPKQKSFYVNRPLNHPQKGVDTDTMAYDLGSSFPAILMVAMGKEKFFRAL